MTKMIIFQLTKSVLKITFWLSYKTIICKITLYEKDVCKALQVSFRTYNTPYATQSHAHRIGPCPARHCHLCAAGCIGVLGIGTGFCCQNVPGGRQALLERCPAHSLACRSV